MIVNSPFSNDSNATYDPRHPAPVAPAHVTALSAKSPNGNVHCSVRDGATLRHPHRAQHPGRLRSASGGKGGAGKAARYAAFDRQ
ncbi:hypothetical protein GCM10010449_14370 [Streptomyces rectiviolaceus]|uniref:Uncharacterized protein n=1 Tax=Streptomyces rectiviolaceus TaxID=332591 RepID=A0ABP6MCP0_9ACTN